MNDFGWLADAPTKEPESLLELSTYLPAATEAVLLGRDVPLPHELAAAADR